MRYNLPASALLIVAFIFSASPASGKTFAIPHVFDTQGNLTSPNVYEMFMYYSYIGGLPGGGAGGNATVNLYLYNEDGTVAQSMTSSNVCNPCTFAMSPLARNESFSIEEKFTSAGGMPIVFLGFAVITVEGSDAEAVGIQTFIVNSHSSPLDLATMGTAPDMVTQTAPATLPHAATVSVENATLLIPSLLETSGTISQQYQFDSWIYFLYTAGLPGAPLPGPVGASQIDIYLYDNATGLPLQSNTPVDVCNPCTEVVGTATPKLGFELQSEIVAKGGFASPAPNVSAVVVITGDGPVVTDAIMFNSHTSPYDADITDVPVQILSSGSPTAADNPSPPLRSSLRAAPNPFNPSTTIMFTIGRPGRVRVDIVSVTGEVVATIYDAHRDVGVHEVVWDGTASNGQPVTSGVYFARMTTAEGLQTRKLALVK